MKTILRLKNYSEDIDLFEEFVPTSIEIANKEKLVDLLLLELFDEKINDRNYCEKRQLLYGNINTFPPHYVSDNIVNKLDQLLQLELQEKKLNDVKMLSKLSQQRIGETKITLWQGDITSLKIDAIVNAANSQLLGCFQPLHKCIDNVIHSAAGIQLRDDCNIIMQKQGFTEPTGIAKITRAYNLPSKYVLHTVGPIVYESVTDQNKADLANSYISCLEICKEIDSIKSIAFCCISTGVFGYPANEAAMIAFNTVSKWLSNNPNALAMVVFNVFTDNDHTIYKELLSCS